MTPDLFAPAVVLDTSIIHNTGPSSAPFQVMKKLIEAGLLRVFIPELAMEEFRTQWRDRNQVNIVQASKALKSLSGESLLPANVTAGADQLSDLLDTVDLEALSEAFAKDYMGSNGFATLPLSFEQARDAWRCYFLGHLPSKKAKHRPDIPDAHILGALKEFVEKEANILFVSADKGQRDSASDIDKVICFDSLDVLIKSTQIAPLISKWEMEQAWQALQRRLPFEEVEEFVRIFVEQNGGDLISWEVVRDPQIPEDNNSANITMYGEPEEIELDGPQDWGAGILRYCATYFSESLLSFNVFRGDAFHVPEWVSVTFGDFDKDHYFDAEGYAVIEVTVDVTVRIRIEAEELATEDLIEDISFETRAFFEPSESKGDSHRP
jgi:hypothetical protein